MKKIYSLNLISYLMSLGYEPKIYRENGEDLFYAQFDECDGVTNAIKEWKKEDLTIQIHKYLNCYRVLRDTIKQMREG